MSLILFQFCFSLHHHHLHPRQQTENVASGFSLPAGGGHLPVEWSLPELVHSQTVQPTSQTTAGG